MSVTDAFECVCPPHALQERPPIDYDCPVHGVTLAFVTCEHGYGWSGRDCPTCVTGELRRLRAIEVAARSFLTAQTRWVAQANRPDDDIDIDAAHRYADAKKALRDALGGAS